MDEQTQLVAEPPARIPGLEITSRRGEGTGAAKSGFHIPSLDGIRALSFLVVFLGHAGWGKIIPGAFGVTVFFFLSGYLITTLLCREAEKTGSIDLKKFYLRRVYRIFPPMYLVLAVSVALTLSGVFHNELQPSRLLAQVMHLTNYFMVFTDGRGMARGTGIFWSLAIEEHFYLFFPLALLFLRRRYSVRAQAAALGAVCAVVLAWRCVLVGWFSFGHAWTYYCTDTRIDSILFGCALALLQHQIFASEKALAALRWLCPAALAVLVFTFVFKNETFRETGRYTLQGIALAPLFVAAILYPDSLWFRWLNAGWICAIGTWSYTMYLIHEIALMVVGEHARLPPWATAAVALAATIVFAALVHQLIEKPFARVRARLHPA